MISFNNALIPFLLRFFVYCCAYLQTQSISKLKHTAVLMFLCLSVFGNTAYALTKIDVPKDFKPRPKGSEMILMDYQLMECFSSKESAESKLEGVSNLVSHQACGEGFAHVLMADQISMMAGEDKTISNEVQIPYLIHEPSIYVEKGHFKVKPKMNKQMMHIADKIVISLSKVIQGHIKATVGVTIQNVHMQDYVAYYEDDQSYVHQKPVRYTRVMTGSETLKLGEFKIISGSMWVEGYEKESDVLPEHSRLWLELRIK
jgi:hypothetical protein